MSTALEKYTSEFEAIRDNPEYQFGIAQQFVASLLSLPAVDRYTLLPLLEQVEDDAFERGFEIRNLDLTLFAHEKAKWESKPQKPDSKATESKDDFNDVLFYVSSKFDGIFQRVKGSFIFKFGNAENGTTAVRFLCDDGCLKHPEVCPFDGTDSKCSIELHPIHDFIQSALADDNVRNQNYLGVFLIAPTLNGFDATLEDVRKVSSLFDSTNFVLPKAHPIQSTDDYELRSFDKGLEILQGYATKVFNNRELSFDDEIIIKKLFAGSEMILDYKFLKRGNTGAKVIEIQPFQGDAGEMARFVVKFDEKDAKRRIEKENRRYEMYVGNYAMGGYSAIYKTTPTREGIRYKYASSDGRTESYSFASIVDDFVAEKYLHKFTVKQVIDELWSCEVFKTWEASRIQVSKAVGELYGDYLGSEPDVLKEIGLIKRIAANEIDELDLVRDYRKIKEFQLSTKQKICHGDLHSENFFKDEKGVYLIDFGWTDKRHALIDYVTLECSLKFKHLPFYIPKEELLEAEGICLTLETFKEGFDVTVIERPALRCIYELVCEIRNSALAEMASPDQITEYLIALFIISFRQIQYRDLNQRYAFSSTEMLGKEIVQILGL